MDDDEPQLEHEENKARLKAVRERSSAIDELADEEWVREETAERVRQLYDYRRRRFSARFDEDGTESDGIEERSEDYQRLVREILDAQRAVLIGLRNEGGSTTTSCGASSASSTSRTRAWRSEVDEREQEILERARSVPEGFVTTYGDLCPEAPRFAGSVMAACEDPAVPWHRVVSADGSLAVGERQRALLEAEGVPFGGARVDLRAAWFAVER